MRDLSLTVTHPRTGKNLKRVTTLDRLAELSNSGKCVYVEALGFRHMPVAFIIGMTFKTVNEWLRNHGLYEVCETVESPTGKPPE